MAGHGKENTSDSNNSDENKEYDPRLDFFSKEFDPLLALRTPNVKVPDVTAKRYDNLSSYKTAIEREKHPKAEKKKKEVDTEPIVRRWLPHQMPVQREVKRNTKNVMTRMENAKGPLALLRKCKDERLRIKVWTRGAKGPRGYCIGYLAAFDKHWNIVLEDVTEFWTRPTRIKVPALDSVEANNILRKRPLPPEITITEHNNKKLEDCTRHVDQFIMRGEHIVFVNILNDDCVPKTS